MGKTGTRVKKRNIIKLTAAFRMGTRVMVEQSEGLGAGSGTASGPAAGSGMASGASTGLEEAS